MSAMCPNSYPNIKRQRGFSVAAAIFIIVIMSLMGAAMLQIVSIGQQSVNQEMTSVKAFLASQSGLQWGMYQVKYITPEDEKDFDTQTVTFADPDLVCCTVDVTSDVTSKDASIVYYKITAHGAFLTDTSPEYAKRRFMVRFRP